MQEEINNINDLRKSLIADYQKLRGGELSVKEAKESSNKAGKIIAACKIELEHALLIGKETGIPFLDVDYSDEINKNL